MTATTTTTTTTEPRTITGEDLSGDFLTAYKGYPDSDDWSGAVFENVSFVGTDFHGVKLAGAVFKNCDLTDAKFDNAVLYGAKFRGANKLLGADFSGAWLRDVDFTYADLDEADFTNANLCGAIFRHCDANRAKFVGAEFDATSVLDFVGLRRADFSGVKGLHKALVRLIDLSFAQNVPTLEEVWEILAS